MPSGSIQFRAVDYEDPYYYKCMIEPIVLNVIINDTEKEMNDDILNAYMNLIRIECASRKSISVVALSTHYRGKLNRNLYKGNIENFQIALIPIFIPNQEPDTNNIGHWSLCIYHNEKALYCDSLGKAGTDISEFITTRITNAVRDITKGKISNVPIEIVESVYSATPSKFCIERQQDWYNCGFHVCSIAEQYLMNETLFIDGKSIYTERNRIVQILESCVNDEYRYIRRENYVDPKEHRFHTSAGNNAKILKAAKELSEGHIKMKKS